MKSHLFGFLLCLLFQRGKYSRADGHWGFGRKSGPSSNLLYVPCCPFGTECDFLLPLHHMLQIRHVKIIYWSPMSHSLSCVGGKNIMLCQTEWKKRGDLDFYSSGRSLILWLIFQSYLGFVCASYIFSNPGQGFSASAGKGSWIMATRCHGFHGLL